MTIIHNDPTLDKAVAFCWETQRMFARARHNGWPAARVREHVNSRKQLWMRFSKGVRTSANAIFKEELNEQLGLPTEQRNPNKPVWLNEQLGIQPDRRDEPSHESTGYSAGSNARIVFDVGRESNAPAPATLQR